MLQRELEHNPSVKTDAAAAFLASLEDPKLTTLGEAAKKPPIEILPPGMASLSAPPITIKKPGALPAPAPTTQNPNPIGTPIGAPITSTNNPIGTPIGAPITAPTAVTAAAPSDDKEKDRLLMLEGPKDETTANNTDEPNHDATKTDEEVVVEKSELPVSEVVDAPKDESSVKSEAPAAESEEAKVVEETKPVEAVPPSV